MRQIWVIKIQSQMEISLAHFNIINVQHPLTQFVNVFALTPESLRMWSRVDSIWIWNPTTEKVYGLVGTFRFFKSSVWHAWQSTTVQRRFSKISWFFWWKLFSHNLVLAYTSSCHKMFFLRKLLLFKKFSSMEIIQAKKRLSVGAVQQPGEKMLRWNFGYKESREASWKNLLESIWH